MGISVVNGKLTATSGSNPRTAAIEKSLATGEPLINTSEPAPSVDNSTQSSSVPSSVAEVSHTLTDYAMKYGLLAGGILAIAIVGTIVVRKLIKRKK